VANPSTLHFGQGLLHGDIQRLYYGVGDRHASYPNIEEDMEFTIVLFIKQKLKEICTKSETELVCSVWTLEKKLFDLYNFCSFVQLYNKSWEINSLLRARSNSTPINSGNLLTEYIDPH
jgi:hypothetical protein